jgi:citrate lyase subunit beta / citryl-CoA lyase
VATEAIVRRSILVVPVSDREAVADCWRHDADAIALDLSDPDFFTNDHRRESVRDATASARRGGAEVFARLNGEVAAAGIEVSAWPGLTGVVLPVGESAAEIRAVDDLLAAAERQHAVPSGTFQIFLLLNHPAAVWRIRELMQSSPRVTSVALDYGALCRNMRILPREDFDPFLYAAGRLVIECTAAGVQPIGISHPLSVLPRLLPDVEMERLAQRGRNTGFKGAICPHPSWIAPCNRAFTPTTEQIDYYREVRRVFAEGIAQGRAAVPIGQQMVDVPVDERAKVQIALWERCRRRDAEKAAALQSASASAG